jgi:RNA polymerase sigma-70 factor (ECF subfamily)
MPAGAAPNDFSSLYAAHSAWLMGWLRRHTRCTHRAADLAQDTFCRVLEKPAALPLREPRSYLATLARRILIDDIRRREIERAYLAIHLARSENMETLTPDRIAEAVQLLSAIMELLQALPDKVCRAFLMIRFDGMGYAQAARDLGVSDRMVKRYVAQAYAHCYALAYQPG